MIPTVATTPSNDASHERTTVANYVLERLIAAFVREDYEEADQMSRFHAVLLGMSDQEYLETA